MENNWTNIETNIRRIGNGFTASISVRRGYPGRSSVETYFATMREAVDHCADFALNEKAIAEIMASEEPYDTEMPF